MIQFNLLPDVKLEYIKAERTRRLVIAVSGIVTVVTLALLLILISISSLQKKHLSDLSRDINTENSQLKKQPQINRVLTVQNQLQSLTDLHAQKPAASRIFDILNQVTPSQLSLNNFTIDFNADTATLVGNGDALASVNKYVDTLKLTQLVTDNAPNRNAFSDIVLASFSLNSKETNGAPANFTINLSFDKTIFDITQKVKLSVPNTTTTRTTLDQPSALFQTPAAGSATKQGAQ